MTKQVTDTNTKQPTLESVREETARLFADLISYQLGMQAALTSAASEEMSEIEAHVDHSERRLLLEPEKYEPIQQAMMRSHLKKHRVLFSRLMWHSVLVLIVLVVERQMRRLGDALGTEMKKIDRALQALNKRGYLPSESESSWRLERSSQTLSDLCDLRDCIVHAAGHYSEMKNAKHLEDLIRRKWRGLKSDNRGILIVDSKFCMWAAQESRFLIESVFKKALDDQSIRAAVHNLNAIFLQLSAQILVVRTSRKKPSAHDGRRRSSFSLRMVNPGDGRTPALFLSRDFKTNGRLSVFCTKSSTRAVPDSCHS